MNRDIKKTHFYEIFIVLFKFETPNKYGIKAKFLLSLKPMIFDVT